MDALGAGLGVGGGRISVAIPPLMARGLPDQPRGWPPDWLAAAGLLPKGVRCPGEGQGEVWSGRLLCEPDLIGASLPELCPLAAAR